MIASQMLLISNILTEIYQAAPIHGNEMCAEIFICNQDGSQWTTLDVALSRGEQNIPDAGQYMYRGYSMRPNETKHVKLLLRGGDSIRVRVSTARVSAIVSAEEIMTPHTLEALEDRLDLITEELRSLVEKTEVAVSS